MNEDQLINESDIRQYKSEQEHLNNFLRDYKDDSIQGLYVRWAVEKRINVVKREIVTRGGIVEKFGG